MRLLPVLLALAVAVPAATALAVDRTGGSAPTASRARPAPTA